MQTDLHLDEEGPQRILKSTLVMGISSVATIILGIIRHKLFALLVGSAGMGLLGVYQSLSNLLSIIFGMGINESGARRIAQEFNKDREAAAAVYLIVKSIAIILGGSGVIIITLLSKHISILTFKDPKYYFDIVLLSSIILFGNIFAAQTALIQGARKIVFLAKINILGALFGTMLSLPLIYIFKMRAVVSYLVIMAITNFISSAWFSKKVEIQKARIHLMKAFKEAVPLIGLGYAFMLGTLIGVATSYFLRIIIIRDCGLDNAGVFQASAIFSSLYVSILLKSMATDFYPRLSATSHDNKICSKLINDQTETGLLIGMPGVLLTIVIAPFLMVALYSRSFLPGVEILRWQILGVLLQLFSWPLGYVLRAKGEGKLFVVTELIYNMSYIIITYFGIRLLGITVLGIAFFFSNFIYSILIYFIVKKKYRINIYKKNIMLLLGGVFASIAVLIINKMVQKWGLFISSLLAIGVLIYSFKRLRIHFFISKIINTIVVKIRKT